MSKKLLSLTVFIAAIAFVVVAALIVMKNFEIDFFKTKTSVTSYTIIEQIKLVAKLQTVEYYGATTVKWEKVDWAKAQSQVLFLGQGKVIANIDLEKMGIEVANEGGRKVVMLKLPEVVVENPIIDKFEIIMACKSFFTAPEISDRERNEAYQQVLKDLKGAAEKNNIRSQALTKAKDYLTTFIAALGYEAKFV
jgi:hypothetical protein